MDPECPAFTWEDVGKPPDEKKQQIIADPKGYIDISYFNFLVASSCILIWFASFSLLYSQDMRKKFVYKTRCAANSVRWIWVFSRPRSGQKILLTGSGCRLNNLNTKIGKGWKRMINIRISIHVHNTFGWLPPKKEEPADLQTPIADILNDGFGSTVWASCMGRIEYQIHS